MSEPSAATIIDGGVIVEIDIAAPRAAVFEHLTVPAKMLQWIGLGGELDIRPGGAFHLQVTADDIARGEFIEVVAPRRVVFSWGWDGSDDVPPGSSTVSIELTETTSGTHVVLTHDGLPAPARADHGEGWRYFARRLARRSTGEDPGPADITQAAQRIDEGDPR